jgi:hypothetical protein
MGTEVEVAFAEIEKEFRETFGYVRQDIAAIRKANLGLNYTVALLICCACQMLAWHKDLEDDQVFTSLLPDTDAYQVIGKTMFEALRNGLAHRFRPDTIKIGNHQWRFAIFWRGESHVSATEGKPNWLLLNVKVLEERLVAKIDAYEEELRHSANARFGFRKKSQKSTRTIPPQATRITGAWKSILAK